MKVPYTLLLLLITRLSFGTTYYVSTTDGNDSRTSTQAQSSATPWKTLAKLTATVSTFVPGDSISFKKGDVFPGSMTCASGISGSYIKYGSYGTGANPIFSGFTTVTSWALVSGNIYSATVTSSSLQGVSVDGTLRGFGRYPNTGYLTYTGTNYNPATPGTPGTTITSSNISTLPDNFVGGEVVIKKYRYILDRHKITSRVGTTLTFTNTNFYGSNSQNPPTANDGYFIQNHLNTLDLDGEWSHGSNTLNMYFSGGVTSGRVVKASTVGTILTMNSTQYVRFTGIDFEGGTFGIDMSGTINIVLSNCNFRQQQTAIRGNDCTQFWMIGVNINECPSNGVFLENNCTNTVMDGVTVNNCGSIPGQGESGDGKYNGISVNGDGGTVKNCTVTNIGFNGITFSGSNMLIYRNLVDSFCSVKDDGAGIYGFTSPPNSSIGWTGIVSNRIVRGNIVLNAIGAPEGAQWNSEPEGQAAAIYFDGYANHTLADSNFCAHGPWYGFLNNANSNNSYTNNTAFDFKYQWGAVVVGIPPTDYGSVRNLVVTNNTFIARTTSQAVIYLELPVNDNPSLLGTFNNNNYSRPIDNDDYIHILKSYSGGPGMVTMTLPTWKSTYSLDLSTGTSPVTVSDPNSFRTDYNYSASTTTIGLPAIYQSIESGATYSLLNLQPYDGAVSAYFGPLVSGGTKMLLRQGKALLRGGKILLKTF